MRKSVRRLLQLGLASLAILAVTIVVFMMMRPAPRVPVEQSLAADFAKGFAVFALSAGLGIAFAVVAAGAFWLVVQFAFLFLRRRNARKAEWFLAPADAVLAAYVAFLVLGFISAYENVRGIRRIEETCRSEKV